MYSRIDNFRRMPALLEAHPEESSAVEHLLTTVDGPATIDLPECGPLWKCGLDLIGSAVFLGGRWALTVAHNGVDNSGDYIVTFPATAVADIRPFNSFSVKAIAHGTLANRSFAKGPVARGEVDLALLRISPDAHSPAVTAAVLATADEFSGITSLRICGFGSGNCTNPGAPGQKHVSDSLPVVANAEVEHLDFDPASQFAVDNVVQRAVACDADSGGPAFAMVGDVRKVAGIIIGTLQDPATGRFFTKCLRLSDYLPWIRQTTGLTL